jgi:hypothetical protein
MSGQVICDWQKSLLNGLNQGCRWLMLITRPAVQGMHLDIKYCLNRNEDKVHDIWTATGKINTGYFILEFY